MVTPAFNKAMAQQNPPLVSNTPAISKKSSIFEETVKAYYASDYKKAAELGEKASSINNQKTSDLIFLYSITGHANAKIGEITKAIDFLEKAVLLGYGKDGQYANLLLDPKIYALRKNSRWTALIDTCRKNFFRDEKSKGNNPDARLLFEMDQAERVTLLPDLIRENPNQQVELSIAMAKRDLARRKQMKKIVENHLLKTSNDYSSAAFVFQHGTTVKDIKLANELAKKGFELAKDNSEKCQSGWLIAATTDRMLWYQGKPQIYGTQSRPSTISLQQLNDLTKNWQNISKMKNVPLPTPGAKKTLSPIDMDKINDQERKNLCVEPLNSLMKGTIVTQQ
jgi:tetratricopeptide (TPR) repeat protein